MTPLESVERMWELSAWADERARIGLREEFPEADGDEIELRLAVLKYGPELMARATGRRLDELTR